MKITTQSRHYLEVDEDLTIEIPFGLHDGFDIEDVVFVDKEKRRVAIVTQDEYYYDDYLDDAGVIYTSSRRDGNINQFLEACENEYMVPLSVYEHGYRVYSLYGQGMQCQFDTVNGGAVWVPSQWQAEELAKVSDVIKREELKLEMCKATIFYYNCLASGDVWMITEIEYDKNWTMGEYETVSGFFGFRDAQREAEKFEILGG